MGEGVRLAEVLRLLLITDPRLLGGREWVSVCSAAIQGGVTAVQVRHPSASVRELAALTRTLIDALPVPVLVNDRLDVALAVGAAGVHLGVDDVPVALARRIVSEGFIIGASVGGDEEVADHDQGRRFAYRPRRVRPDRCRGQGHAVRGNWRGGPCRCSWCDRRVRRGSRCSVRDSRGRRFRGRSGIVRPRVARCLILRRSFPQPADGRQVLPVCLGEDVPASRIGHEVEVRYIRGVERRLDTGRAGGRYRSRG